LVSHFSGDDDISIEEFITMAEVAAFLGQWSDPQTIAAARFRLIGTASEFVDTVSSLCKTWANLAEALRKRFQPRTTSFVLDEQFVACVQRKGETAGPYATRIRLLSRKLRYTLQ
jgi:hypothetical protein